MNHRTIFTYQTRPQLTTEQAAVLDAYAALYGRAERSLFAALQAGGALNALKRAFLPRFGISARQFNAIRVGLEGKIDSIKERRPELIAEATTRIKQAIKVIAKLGKKAPRSNKLHQKKRRLATLQSRLAVLKADHASNTVRLCFGSKRLFRAQFDLAANGYADHDEWKSAWQRERSNQFFVIGSQDETAGCQGCQAILTENGSLNLQLRLPDALATQGKYLMIEGARFAYGHEQITAALASSQRMMTKTQAGKAIVKRTGTALGYRFVRDEKGWRVFVSVEVRPIERVSCKELGAIGVDVNADHLAVAETDRFGNLIAVRRIPLPLYGKTTEQAKAIIGDACVGIASQAHAAGKSVVIEMLHFAKKKAELESVDGKQARMLSSFACNKVAAGIKAACFRQGIDVIAVNPAYTSVIGAVNHAQSKGISVHQGAAFAIARRGLGFSERPTVREAVVPARNGGHITFALPVRNRAKHGWSFWSNVRTKQQAAHAAHFRCGAHQTAPPPLPPARPGARSTWNSTSRLRGANRSQHCSESVWQDVPY